ncbi:MAG: PilZ domain-containing protein [Acidobacteriota bacterium]|nr:PilZ domain-containing protein [Acidobacteriota bacterium]MDE3169048.1 PilZ domain-containing protein [Acidobacteriota bacterium]
MASARAMLERRRSSRVPMRIPVKVHRSDSNHDIQDAPAEAISVSRYGALLRASFLPELGSRIEVRHGLSNEVREFRVISVRSPREKNIFELGVEIYHPAKNFWGVQFPDERFPA